MASRKYYDKDAFAYISDNLKAWGLNSLAADVRRMLEAGASADRIQIEIQDLPAYKRRFAANEARVKKGLPPLPPDQYLAVEAPYRQVMQAAGTPIGFYDEPSDFENWIANDVAPTEIQGRVQAAQSVVEAADPTVREEFERLYGKGDLIAYALDPKRTQEMVAKQAEAARISSAAEGTGFGGLQWRSNAERLVEMGMTEQQARVGFAQAKRQLDAFGRLAGTYGEQYGRKDAFDDVFFNDAGIAETRTRLASQERAAFSGGSGVNEAALGQRTAGRL